jgi:pyruvate dehydrogenase E1 component
MIDPRTIQRLEAIEKKLLWLSSWTIHHANHLRPARDKLKVGGHQASCASCATILTALFFHTMRGADRIAVKPHASPIMHAALYLMGLEPRERLERFRALGGAQAYPSRTKDVPVVDFSTGSVGLGAAVTLFASLTQDLLRQRGLVDDAPPPGRMIAVVGDAELDEGNVFEALLEGWKYDVRNVWWVIDYNRQSLDRVVPEKLFSKIEGFFDEVGWEVVTVKYGKKLQAVFAEPGGEVLRRWIDDCPNDLYAALTFKGGAAWRAELQATAGGDPFIAGLLERLGDDELAQLMTNLGGHDVEAMLEAFDAVGDDRPRCFIAYTVKGWGLPLAGHKDNHAGLMTPDQVDHLRRAMGIAQGEEWQPFAGMAELAEDLSAFIDQVPFRQRIFRHQAAPVPVPPRLGEVTIGQTASTQEVFGKLMAELGRSDSELAGRLVTTSPDVTVSTSLGAWVSRRAVFHGTAREDVFRQHNVASPTRWRTSPTGQHMELGIAENNLFLLLAALGLAHETFGARLLPVGTLYDPFICRGLDALNYACYQDARFLLVATPSGITLSPEGGAHQSISTPLIGMGQPGLTYFEPAFADELAPLMRFAFEHMQADGGGSVYLRLSTRQIVQPERRLDEAALLAGAYWLVPPADGAELAIVAQGAVLPEAMAAHAELAEDVPGIGLLVVSSADRLIHDWRAAGKGSQVAGLLASLAPDAALVTVLDGHPATLAWLGSVRGQLVESLGVDRFGQSADIPDLYAVHGLDPLAIVDAAARAMVARLSRNVIVNSGTTR